MKTQVSLLSAMVLCAALGACHTRPDKPAALPEKLASKAEVTVTEMQPDDQLYKALEMFGRGDYAACSTQIQAAAKSMRTIAFTADLKRKSAIEKTADNLDQLATSVAAHNGIDINKLYTIFEKAGRTLAGNRLSITEHEYFNHSEGKSGALLAATVRQLETSIITHHRALSNNEQLVLNNALDVARKLETGNQVTEDDLRNTLQNIDTEIDKWNKEFGTL